MAKTYRTSRGEVVNMDMLRLANEETIAVGNMRTNARGDELGPGGKIVKSKAQIMAEYHRLNTPMADNSPVTEQVEKPQVQPATTLKTPVAQSAPVTQETAPTEYVKPRGSFASTVEETTQENTSGINRI